ncbi:hypothetical protein L202_06544 [Cryptococcus amylolentus CBS 6039]|uniref:RWD domain-containing protein n=2 Tax=Cryptococcus amylolentus TaxID=104669 RepID=A0A1E3HGX9_9TREE|nr:hypothetical protein L202_06544 [Cryptococcus amylolentus CBS 6039]ODN75385.1 hypothetical protein L202_06544 [Cryptococcus amylolentus CBS 6039]ODO03127.1 hypothetical protein I350_05972 [Cryptococcus amylolentus CBS 6273]
MSALSSTSARPLSSALAQLSIDTDARIEPDVRTPPITNPDPHGTLLKFIKHLLSEDHLDANSNLTAIGYELEALLSIYGDDSIKLALTPPSTAVATEASSQALTKSGSQQWSDAVWDAEIGFAPGERIRYEVSLPLWEEGETLEGLDSSATPEIAPTMRVLVSLAPTYPNSSAPQLQLLGKYLGSFAIDAGLFGDITRTYLSAGGAGFTPGDVCVFEGLTHVQSLARDWYAIRLSSGAAREAERNFHLTVSQTHSPEESEDEDVAYLPRPSPRPTFSYTRGPDEVAPTQAMLRVEAGKDHGLKVWVSDEVVDRKSVFLGRAIKVTDEREVPLIVHGVLEDKRAARAAHPAIYAYRVVKNVGGTAQKVYMSDYDDDGESQAGGRLQHLLEILELENVLVIVTRWWGGHRLGADRFKHINRVARDALEIGGFLEDKKTDGKSKKGKK